MDWESQKLRGGGIDRIWILCLCTLMSLQAVPVLSQGGANSTDPIETSALLAFKSALIDNDNNLQNWVNTTDPCNNNWNGVFCYPFEQPANSSNYLHVTELRLLQMNLGGNLVPELGNLSGLVNLDVMRNHLTGPIPSTLGNLKPLKILTVSGNMLSGTIPPELGSLTQMNRIQLDENQLTGPIPSTFGNLTSLAHLHLNNNSFTGGVPPDLGRLPNMLHILLDSNNLSGPLPSEIANARSLIIIQLDNNKFSGGIPPNYTANLPKLTKLSCRNCSLSGTLPDLSSVPHLNIVDLSYNNFSGYIPNIVMTNVNTIDFSHNQLVGGFPPSWAEAPVLQTLRLSNNRLNGTIPDFATNMDYGINSQLLDFQNNDFNYISLDLIAQGSQTTNLRVWLSGNSDICSDSKYITELAHVCQPGTNDVLQGQGNVNNLPRGGPIVVQYRLKSPGFTIFTSTYETQFTNYLAYGLKIDPSQVYVQSYQWQPGPRLYMIILINPPANSAFNETEVQNIERPFTNWNMSNSTFYGPYELLGFNFIGKGKSKLGTGAIAGIVVGSVALILTLILLGLGYFLVLRRRKALSKAEMRRRHMMSTRGQQSMLKITGVTSFTYKEMVQATDNFSVAKEVGRGGYGKVYRGVLETGQVVAIKRATIEAIQRNSEFYNEIELLSRCHHRNLVVLVGFCNDEEEQMLVYEFMERGTLHDHLHSDEKAAVLDFATRLKIALGSAKGILYLHTEADPPIFHRDIKSNNMLLDEKTQAKVADFGLSRLAPDLDDLETASHVSTVVKGTPGYLDPEYFLTRQLTDKSDVYSFGVVLLELATGMMPISFGKNIVREVRPSYENGEIGKIVDSKMGEYPPEAMETFMKLALACVNTETESRPTMQEVTRTLERLMMETQGKGGLSSITGVDISREVFAAQLRKGKSFDVENDDDSTTIDTGFDTGLSRNSKIEPESTTFTSNHGKDYVLPR